MLWYVNYVKSVSYQYIARFILVMSNCLYGKSRQSVGFEILRPSALTLLETRICLTNDCGLTFQSICMWCVSHSSGSMSILKHVFYILMMLNARTLYQVSYTVRDKRIIRHILTFVHCNITMHLSPIIMNPRTSTCQSHTFISLTVRIASEFIEWLTSRLVIVARWYIFRGLCKERIAQF
jgi:hypothetical protein